jgi:nitroreductase
MVKKERSMEFFAVVNKRRTVREFKEKAVPKAAICRALQAGLLAPSNAHLKSWQFILLKELAAEGLYGCTYTPCESKGLKKFLDVPAGYEIAAVIPFGYAKEPPRKNKSEDLAARLHVDGWG